MKKYTKEQLIEAQFKYNKEVVSDPEKFEDNPDWEDEETAIDQINYLLSLIDAE